jgi:hypothetical protein
VHVLPQQPPLQAGAAGGLEGSAAATSAVAVATTSATAAAFIFWLGGASPGAEIAAAWE